MTKISLVFLVKFTGKYFSKKTPGSIQPSTTQTWCVNYFVENSFHRFKRFSAYWCYKFSILIARNFF